MYIALNYRTKFRYLFLQQRYVKLGVQFLASATFTPTERELFRPIT
jgi:hypothetical protein